MPYSEIFYTIFLYLDHQEFQFFLFDLPNGDSKEDEEASYSDLLSWMLINPCLLYFVWVVGVLCKGENFPNLQLFIKAVIGN